MKFISTCVESFSRFHTQIAILNETIRVWKEDFIGITQPNL